MASCRRYGMLALLCVNTAVFFAFFHAFTGPPGKAPRRPEPAAPDLMHTVGLEYAIDSRPCGAGVTPILVHSSADHFARRAAIRRAYPRTALRRLGLRHVFMVGAPDNARVQTRLVRESSRFGDVVQGRWFRDAYRNLTYKHMMALRWSADRCPRSARVVKMDDDVAVNPYRLRDVVAARGYQLTGCVIAAKPIRDPRNKWYVSRDEYAADAYPHFLSGWLYVATAESVHALLRAVGPREKYFWIDDLYVTGVLAQRARIPLTDLRPDFETDPGPVHCCVSDRQRCGFLAAPTGDDLDVLEKFTRRLADCRAANLTCDAFRKSKRHHACLDLWKKPIIDKRKGKPSVEVLN